jgi:hypothetical protein
MGDEERFSIGWVGGGKDDGPHHVTTQGPTGRLFVSAFVLVHETPNSLKLLEFSQRTS